MGSVSFDVLQVSQYHPDVHREWYALCLDIESPKEITELFAASSLPQEEILLTPWRSFPFEDSDTFAFTVSFALSVLRGNSQLRNLDSGWGGRC